MFFFQAAEKSRAYMHEWTTKLLYWLVVRHNTAAIHASRKLGKLSSIGVNTLVAEHKASLTQIGLESSRKTLIQSFRIFLGARSAPFSLLIASNQMGSWLGAAM